MKQNKRRRFIADYEEQLRELYGQKLNDAEIAEKLGFDKASICKFRNKLGLPSHYSFRRNPKGISNHKMQFMELYNQGLSDGNIGKELGFHKGTVSIYRRKKLGLPANFKFARDKVVFSEEEKEKITEMHFNGISISAIAREFGIGIPTMLKRCQEMGLDTSIGAKRWIRMENNIVKLWSYLEDHGPTTQREIWNNLNISAESLQEYVANLMDIFETFKFAIGTGSGSYGGIKYKSHEVYGDLSYNTIGNVISLKDDPRLIDYIAERVPFKVENWHDAQTLVMHFKNKIGVERARKVVEARGYTYKHEAVKRNPLIELDQIERLK